MRRGPRMERWFIHLVSGCDRVRRFAAGMPYAGISQHIRLIRERELAVIHAPWHLFSMLCGVRYYLEWQTSQKACRFMALEKSLGRVFRCWSMKLSNWRYVPALKSA